MIFALPESIKGFNNAQLQLSINEVQQVEQHKFNDRL